MSGARRSVSTHAAILAVAALLPIGLVGLVTYWIARDLAVSSAQLIRRMLATRRHF